MFACDPLDVGPFWGRLVLCSLRGGDVGMTDQRVLVATLGGFAMMMVELVLYIIRSYEVQEYEVRREIDEPIA